MANKAKRAPKRPAEPAALVDLNLWDVMFGLLEPAEAPETPRHDPKSGEGEPAEASEAEREEAGEEVRAAGRRASQGSRRKRRREGQSGSET